MNNKTSDNTPKSEQSTVSAPQRKPKSKKKVALYIALLLFAALGILYSFLWSLLSMAGVPAIQEALHRQGLERAITYQNGGGLEENLSVTGFPFFFGLRLENIEISTPHSPMVMYVAAETMAVHVNVIRALWGGSRNNLLFPVRYRAENFIFQERDYGSFFGETLEVVTRGIPASGGYPTALRGEELRWQLPDKGSNLACRELTIEADYDVPIITQIAALEIFCEDLVIAFPGYEENIAALAFLFSVKENRDNITLENGFLAWRGGEIYIEGEVDQAPKTLHANFLVEIRNYPAILSSLRQDQVLDAESYTMLETTLRDIAPLLGNANDIRFPVALENNIILLPGMDPLPVENFGDLQSLFPNDF